MKPTMRKFKINLPISNCRKGQIVTLACDVNGVPVAYYWRSRYVDSKMDNCMEALDDESKETENEGKEKENKKIKKSKKEEREEIKHDDNF